MIGLLVGVDFTPSPEEFQTLLDSGDLVPGLQYVTIELTAKEAADEKYLATMFQGAAVQQGWAEGVSAKFKVKKAKVHGKPVVIVYPVTASPSTSVAPVSQKRYEKGTIKVIEVEAETLEEAKEQINSQIPEGFDLISEEVISDGRQKSVRAVADTVEAAFEKAQAEIPNDVDILEREELTAPDHKIVVIEAFDEQYAASSARYEGRNLFGGEAIVKNLKLATPGRRGLFGLGKKPHQYEAEIIKQAVVKITYKTQVKLSAKIGKQAEQLGQEFSEAILQKPIQEQLDMLRYLCTCDEFGSDEVATYLKMSEPIGMQWNSDDRKMMLNANSFLAPKRQNDGTILNGYDQVRIMLIEVHAKGVGEGIKVSGQLISDLALNESAVKAHASFLTEVTRDVTELTKLFL